MQTVLMKNAPAPAGHYSQATVVGDLVFISGQLPIDPTSGEKILSSIEDQTERVLRNVFAVAEEAGSSKDKIVKTTVYVSDISSWARVNKVYAELFGDHRPARAIVPTKELHFGFGIEIEAIAVVG